MRKHKSEIIIIIIINLFSVEKRKKRNRQFNADLYLSSIIIAA